jgi:hypothetical protein
LGEERRFVVLAGFAETGRVDDRLAGGMSIRQRPRPQTSSAPVDGKHTSNSHFQRSF